MLDNKEEVDNDIGEDKDQTAMNNCKRVQLARPCLTDLVETGWKKLHEMNVKKVRMVADKWTQCKRKTSYYIMDRVVAMKEESMKTTIPPELDGVEDSVWIMYLRELRYNHAFFHPCFVCCHPGSCQSNKE